MRRTQSPCLRRQPRRAIPRVGRPFGKKNPKFTLKPVADKLGKPVAFLGDCVGEEVEKKWFYAEEERKITVEGTKKGEVFKPSAEDMTKFRDSLSKDPETKLVTQEEGIHDEWEDMDCVPGGFLGTKTFRIQGLGMDLDKTMRCQLEYRSCKMERNILSLIAMDLSMDGLASTRCSLSAPHTYS